MQDRKSDLGKIKKNIDYIMKNLSGKRENIVYRIYEELAAAYEEAPAALRYFCEYAVNNTDTSHAQKRETTEEIFGSDEKAYFIMAYGKLIDGALEALLQKNTSYEKFYVELWDFIEHNTILKEKKQKAFALYYIWIDARIPYFKLDEGLRMDNDRFKELAEKLLPVLMKARFILLTPTEQRTQIASRILKLLDNAAGEEEKAVVMAYILGMLETRRETEKKKEG